MKSHFFSPKLIDWYHKNKRDLPWRETTDPYKIWLSEVILQQTRVNQGLPYYLKFVKNYPSVEDLALADERSVLRDWQGLGYYSRARNLHKCARIVHESYKNKFPKSYNEIIKLPGIGKYTAAAISSFSAREVVPAIDGNVYRVLSRVFGITDDIATGKGQKSFEQLSTTLIPHNDPDTYNQAVMEFGAIHCTPKAPKCEGCIFDVECYARKNRKQAELPIKSKKIKVRKRFFSYVNVVVQDQLLLRERTGKDIWKGLYDFYLIESKVSISFDNLLKTDEFLTSLKTFGWNAEVSQEYKHILTHQHILATFYTISVEAGVKDLLDIIPSGYSFYSHQQVSDVPKPVLISKYLNDSFY